jgi:hypothetical protein
MMQLKIKIMKAKVVWKMKINKPIIQFRIGAVGSLLATAIAVLSQLASVDKPDKFLNNAITFLAISIPFLALDVYLLISELIIEKTAKNTLRGLLRLISIILFFVAMANIFFHFSQIAGILFSVITLLSVFLFVRFYKALQNNKNEEK